MRRVSNLRRPWAPNVIDDSDDGTNYTTDFDLTYTRAE